MRKQTQQAHEQLVALRFGFCTYYMPIDQAHIVQKAMMHAKREDMQYNAGKSYARLLNVDVVVSTNASDHKTFDLTSYTSDQANDWTRTVNEGLADGGEVADIMPPVEYFKVKGK